MSVGKKINSARIFLMPDRLTAVKTKRGTQPVYDDPNRLYEQPIWTDLWFIIGFVLVVPDVLVFLTMLVKSGFSLSLTGHAIGGYPFFIGRTVALAFLGSVLPVLIRRSSRRERFRLAPARIEPGFQQDPVHKGVQRLWDGEKWTIEVKARRKKDVPRVIFISGVFFAISLLLGMGFATKALDEAQGTQSSEAGAVPEAMAGVTFARG